MNKQGYEMLQTNGKKAVGNGTMFKDKMNSVKVT